MILVTGGKYQGKSTFAGQAFPGRKIWMNYEDRIADFLTEVPEKGMETAGSKVLRLVKQDLEYDPDCVVVLSEIGCGITPVKAEERLLRDAVGQAGCYLAGCASEVYRVTAGLPMRLK